MTRKKSLMTIFAVAAFIISIFVFTLPVRADGGLWKENNGSWTYEYPDGSKATGWTSIGGKWYFFESNGKMFTGWRADGGSWYYLEESGAMATGWTNVDGKWYLMSDGGAMKTGWVKDNGEWYYLKPDGTMFTGWLNSSGWYYLQDSGAMATGWVKVGDDWYYMNNGGVMQTGWVWTGGYWYYMNGAGVMQTGWIQDGGTWYDLGATGAMADDMTGKAQSYSSSTGYLILVNRTTHTVGIYTGSQGKWTQYKSFACTDGYDTPTGVYSIGSHTYHFGEEKGYTCWYATQITGEILFHSVLYNVNSMTSIQDGRLGITASHGCIRLDIEDAKYIYNNIPSGTTVVIY